MAREPKNYEHLIGKIKGLSENQLKAHFTLYQGYVKKLNEIETKLGTVDKRHAELLVQRVLGAQAPRAGGL